MGFHEFSGAFLLIQLLEMRFAVVSRVNAAE
jgi:hypothetical protein